MNNLGRSITPATYVREKQSSKLPTDIAVDAKLDKLEVGCFIFCEQDKHILMSMQLPRPSIWVFPTCFNPGLTLNNGIMVLK